MAAPHSRPPRVRGHLRRLREFGGTWEIVSQATPRLGLARHQTCVAVYRKYGCATETGTECLYAAPRWFVAKKCIHPEVVMTGPLQWLFANRRRWRVIFRN
ncbi:hypothetical protein HRbin36_02279 [bacterium HR36]|nr:hypothetical protein HRbin36_02279 [bacterium HR36]